MLFNRLSNQAVDETQNLMLCRLTGFHTNRKLNHTKQLFVRCRVKVGLNPTNIFSQNGLELQGTVWKCTQFTVAFGRLERNLGKKKRSNSDPLIFQVSIGFDIFRVRLSFHCTNTSSTQIRPLFNFPSSRTHILWIVKLKMVTRPLISLTSASKYNRTCTKQHRIKTSVVKVPKFLQFWPLSRGLTVSLFPTSRFCLDLYLTVTLQKRITQMWYQIAYHVKEFRDYFTNH